MKNRTKKIIIAIVALVIIAGMVITIILPLSVALNY